MICLQFVTWFLLVCLHSPDFNTFKSDNHSSGKCSASSQDLLWSFTKYFVSWQSWKLLCLFRQPQIVSLLADGQIGWGLWCGWGSLSSCWGAEDEEGRAEHKSTCSTPRSHWIEEPLVNSPSNLMAVEIIENLRIKTRERGEVYAMKIVIRECFILTWKRWSGCRRVRN